MPASARQSRISKQTTIFAFLSVALFFIGALFIAINANSNKRTLEKLLHRQSMEHHAAYQLAMNLTYRNMMQMAEFVSRDPTVSQLFKQGRDAVLAEGGGKGGVQANKYRQLLLNHLTPSWSQLVKTHDIRQLHFHLSPGSLSFLRVHKPEKYGDRMDDLRYTVVDTNAEQIPRSGFETGRVYSGIRAIIPVFHDNEHIGALEVGTSFSNIMHIFEEGLGNDQVAVLLNADHVESAMWPEAIEQRFPGQNKLGNFYIEAMSQDTQIGLLSSAPIPEPISSVVSRIIKYQGDYFSLTLIPLRDYRHDRPGGKTAGVILLANSINDEINVSTRSLHHNLMFALVSFIILEVLIFLAIRYATRRLQSNIDNKLAHIEELNSHLARQAITDSLTGLHNHHFFIERLGEEMSKSRRNGRPLCLIMLDIDHFKQVNDTYGHQAGDRVLKIFADTLKAEMRTGDEVGRYGGEEFALALTSTSLDEAMVLANRLLAVTRELRVASAEGGEIRFTVSMGIAQWDNIEPLPLLIERADQALFSAKNNGRNCIEVAQPR